MKSTHKLIKATGILLVLSASPLAVAEIYRWVDDNGITHFSQMPPDHLVTDVSQLTLPDTRPSDYDPERDIYGVEAQAERMRELREERQAKRQARLERQRAAQKYQPVQYRDQYYGYPFYRPGWVNPRPPLRPNPPVIRPPEMLLPTPPVARPPSLSSRTRG